MTNIFKKQKTTQPAANTGQSQKQTNNEKPLVTDKTPTDESANLQGGQKADKPAETKLCWRCKGDGKWHSTKTGVRALTSSEPLVDLTKDCPECKGSGRA